MGLIASRRKESFCYKCKTVVAFDQKIGLFCPKCGTFLKNKPPEKYWLFQFNPKIYRWHNQLREIGSSERWLVSRYSTIIGVGNGVVLWSSGREAGVYGLGKINSYPRVVELTDEEAKLWVDKSAADKFKIKRSVLVKYSKVLKKPLSEEQCHAEPLLQGLAVFFNPQGTNFRLKQIEWEKIVELTSDL